MTTKYLYVDDEPDSATRPNVDAVNRSRSDIVLELRRPVDFAEQLAQIASLGADGLILDLRLDLTPNDAGRLVQYRASSLAQEVRTRASEGSFKAFPIVLWSTSERLSHSYDRDPTGHDLFDRVHVKNAVANSPGKIANELVALAGGYAAVSTVVAEEAPASPYMRSLLAVGEGQPLDPRIEEPFLQRLDATPAHEYARFVLSDLIHEPGPLIDELRLAAILGVRQDTRSWRELRDGPLQEFAYRGVFSDGWSRWWKTLVDAWWTSIAKGSRPLRLISADERVKILGNVTGLPELEAAKPIQQGYSTRFTTICEALEVPLDPIDGFLIRSREPEPWQERRYISQYAAVERIGYTDRGLRVHPLERQRYETLIESLEGRAAG